MNYADLSIVGPKINLQNESNTICVRCSVFPSISRRKKTVDEHLVRDNMEIKMLIFNCDQKCMQVTEETPHFCVISVLLDGIF